MFYKRVSRILSGGGGCLWQTADIPPGQTHPLGRHPLGRQTHPSQDGHCSRRYASYWNALLLTRMHSSRMRTVNCRGHLPGGVFPGGSAQAVSAWGDVCSEGCLPRRGVCPGVCLPRGCTPPCGQTDTRENIIFPQLLLQTAIIVVSTQ